MSRRVSLIAAFACAVLMLPRSLLAQQEPPTGDSWVTSAVVNGVPYADTNFGSSIALVVASNANAYMQFSLGSIPAGAHIGKATLRLYVNAVNSAGRNGGAS